MTENKTYTITLPSEIAQTYEKQAQKLNCSASLLISQFLTEYKYIFETEKDLIYPQITLETIVSYRLKHLGVPVNIKGYEYLKSAIIETINDYTVCDMITKSLYPKLAKHFKTKPSIIRSGIKSAINITFCRGNKDSLRSLFRYNVSINKPPTAKEFIMTIAESIAKI